MKFLFVLTYFLIVFFTNLPQPFVRGAGDRFEKIRRCYYYNPNGNVKSYSLVELSFLIRILESIVPDEFYANDDPILDILVGVGEGILGEHNLSNDNFLQCLVIKIDNVINYYDRIIAGYEIVLGQEIGVNEKNFYLLYHLYALARTLIRMFFQSNYFGTYTTLFRRNTEKSISLIRYVKAYDVFEVQTNRLHIHLVDLNNIFSQRNNFDVVHDGVRVNYVNAVKTLEEVEAEIINQYAVNFRGDRNHENLNTIRRYKEIIFSFTRPTDNAVITNEELTQLDNIAVGNDLYRLFYSEYILNRQNLQSKLEELLINPYLFDQMGGGIVYNYASTELITLYEGEEYEVKIPELLTRQFNYRQLYSTLRPATRRRRRNGNGGSGGNGRGGPSQRGRRDDASGSGH